MKLNTNHPNGFSIIGILAIVVLIGVIGFAGWRVWEVDKANNLDTQDNSSLPTSPSTDPNEGYVVIKEWGVRFRPVEGLSGIRYFTPEGLDANSFTFTTTELAKQEPTCNENTEDILLGLVTRSSAAEPQFGGVLAQINGQYYQYRGPQAPCSQGSLALENQTLTALSQSLKSLEAAK